MKSAEQRKTLNSWLERHRGLIFKVVRAYTRNHQDSEDLFQEIALQLWQSIPGYRGDCAETTWIYRVAFFAAASTVPRRSRAETASSQITSFGCRIIARAMPTRWRWPPDSSCG